MLPLDGIVGIWFFFSSDEVAFYRDQALYFIVKVPGLRPWDNLLFTSILEVFHPSKPQGGKAPLSLNDQFTKRFSKE